MGMKSGAWEFNAEDFYKSIKAGFWNVLSLAVVLIPLVAALPEDQLPTWVLWLIAPSGIANTIIFGLWKWKNNNRMN